MNTELVFKFEDNEGCFAEYDWMDKKIIFYLGAHNKENGEHSEKEIIASIMDDMNHEFLHSVIIKQHGKLSSPAKHKEVMEQEWLVFLMNGWKKFKHENMYIRPFDKKATSEVLKWIGVLDV